MRGAELPAGGYTGVERRNVTEIVVRNRSKENSYDG